MHDKRPHLAIRTVSLFLIFLMVIGPAMGYASVGALTAQIKKEYDVNDSQVVSAGTTLL